MKILFSPSEAKLAGGTTKKINTNSFIFPELYEKRLQIVALYQDYINTVSEELLIKLFGTKKANTIEQYKGEILQKPLMKVIERYNGVAYEYLNYNNLKKNEQHYINTNVIIFSNLFGPLLAGDFGIPDYKLKQGEKLNTFVLEKFYKENFTSALNDYLKGYEILDLRAGFYEKFYTIQQEYFSVKFIKNGKVVSHWAKAYRGILLKKIAQHNIISIKQLLNLDIETLKIKEIQKIKNHSLIIYDILDI